MIAGLEIVEFVDYYLRNPLEFTYEWRTDIVDYDTGKEQRNQIWSAPKRRWNLNWNGMLAPERDLLLAVHQRARGRYDTFLLKDRISYSGSYSHTVVLYDFEDATVGGVGEGYLSIVGNHVTDFFAGQKIFVTGAGANAGTWTVVSASYDSTEPIPETDVLVEEAVGSVSGVGDILLLGFQLTDTYVDGSQSWEENVEYIETGTLQVWVDDILQTDPGDYSEAEGVLTFVPGEIPTAGEVVSASFEYYFPVRFDSDSMTASKTAATLWEFGSLALVEVK